MLSLALSSVHPFATVCCLLAHFQGGDATIRPGGRGDSHALLITCNQSVNNKLENNTNTGGAFSPQCHDCASAARRKVSFS